MLLKFIEKPVLISTPPSPLKIAFDQRPTDLYNHLQAVPSQQYWVLETAAMGGDKQGKSAESKLLLELC